MLFCCIITILKGYKMRPKSLLLILLIPIIGFSSYNIGKINEILSAIKKEGKILSYFSSDTDFISKLSIKKSQDPNSADIIIFPKGNISNKSVIVHSFNGLKTNKNSIGAIYLKKGRTQIIFVEERLKKKGLFLSTKYQRYIIKECYLTELCLFNSSN